MENRNDNERGISPLAALLGSGSLGIGLLVAAERSLYMVAEGTKSPDAWPGIIIANVIGIGMLGIAGSIALGPRGRS